MSVPLVSPASVRAKSEVTIVPGQSIQAAVDANPAGTIFRIRRGVFRQQRVVPKDSDAFIGDPGAVLTGEDATDYAFKWDWGRYPRAVRIQGLTIEHYASPQKKGPILAGWDEGYPYGTTGWVVEQCEIRYNAAAGIRTGDHMQVLRNYIHHNGQIGVVGTGDSVLLQGNEIAYNNYQHAYDYWWEAGGAKFVITTGLIVRGNYVHNNTGPGLWSDIDSRNSLYETNRVEDNVGVGILYEISYGAVIRNNTALRNGAGQNVWLHGAGIFVQNSSNVEIYGNTVADNYNGITAVQQNRGSGQFGPWITRNVFIHDNHVSMRTGLSGFAQDIADRRLFNRATVRFDRNTYHVYTSAVPFAWNDTWISAAQWQASGQDTAGIVTP